MASLLLIILLLSFAYSQVSAFPTTTFINLNQTYSAPYELLSQVCTGHLTRAAPTAVYNLGTNGNHNDPSRDSEWFKELYPDGVGLVSDLKSYVENTCLPTLQKVVTYSYSTQREFLPSLISACIALDALPYDVSSMPPLPPSVSVTLDITAEWSSMQQRDTVSYILDRYSDSFAPAKLAKLDPGYSYPTKRPLQYNFTGFLDVGLVDFVVKERLFTFFLPLGCVPFTDDHKVHEAVVSAFAEGDGSPITVFGEDAPPRIANAEHQTGPMPPPRLLM